MVSIPAVPDQRSTGANQSTVHGFETRYKVVKQRTKRGPVVALTLATVIVIAGVLGYGAYAGWFNGEFAQKKTPPVAVTFDYARDAAVAAAYNYQASSWSVVNSGAAMVPTTQMPGGVDLLTITSLVKNCSVGGDLFTNITVPEFDGNLSLGESPFWYLWMSNGIGGLVLITVVNGTATWAGDALNCSPPSLLSTTAAISPSAVDSSVILNTTQHDGGATFVASHVSVTVTLTGFGAINHTGAAQPPLWFVNYTTCPLSTGSVNAVAPNAAEQTFTVYANNGTLFSKGPLTELTAC